MPEPNVAKNGTVRLDEVEEGIWKITLSRPKRLNALNFDLLEDLKNALTWIQQNDQVCSFLVFSF